MEYGEPAALDLGDVVLASGPFGMLVGLLAVPALCVTLFGLPSKTAATPMMGVAVNVGVLLLGLLGTLLGWITSPSYWTATTPPSLEDYGRILWCMTQDLLPPLFAVLLGGPLLVLSLISVALKLGPREQG